MKKIKNTHLLTSRHLQIGGNYKKSPGLKVLVSVIVYVPLHLTCSKNSSWSASPPQCALDYLSQHPLQPQPAQEELIPDARHTTLCPGGLLKAPAHSVYIGVASIYGHLFKSRRESWFIYWVGRKVHYVFSIQWL